MDAVESSVTPFQDQRATTQLEMVKSVRYAPFQERQTSHEYEGNIEKRHNMF